MASRDALMPQELEETELQNVQNVRQKAGNAEAQRRRDMHELMHNDAFRRFLWEILGMTGMNANSLDFDSIQRQYFLLGKAAAGKDISEYVQRYQAEQYLLMIKENMDKED